MILEKSLKSLEAVMVLLFALFVTLPVCSSLSQYFNKNIHPANRGHDANVIAAAIVFQIPSWLGS